MELDMTKTLVLTFCTRLTKLTLNIIMLSISNPNSSKEKRFV